MNFSNQLLNSTNEIRLFILFIVDFSFDLLSNRFYTYHELYRCTQAPKE